MIFTGAPVGFLAPCAGVPSVFSSDPQAAMASAAPATTAIALARQARCPQLGDNMNSSSSSVRHSAHTLAASIPLLARRSRGKRYFSLIGQTARQTENVVHLLTRPQVRRRPVVKAA